MYNGRHRVNEKNEFKFSYKLFKERYGLNIKLIDASSIFLKI